MPEFLAGAFLPGELPALADITARCARPGMVVVEIGSYTGRSALAMLPTIAAMRGHLYCVDWFQGSTGCTDPLAASYTGRDIQAVFQRNIAEAGYAECVTIIRGTSLDAARVFAPGVADLLFLDADHRYSSVSADIRAWRPALRPGGVFAGHDIEQEYPELDPRLAEQYAETDCHGDIHYGVAHAVWQAFGRVSRPCARMWYTYAF